MLIRRVFMVAWPAATFGISGSLRTNLAPGFEAPLDLVLSNPSNHAIRVLDVTITVEPASLRGGQPNPACLGTDHLVVVEQLEQEVVVPEGVSRTLTQLGVPTGELPTVGMRNLPANQDACKSTTFTFTYPGTATKR